MQLKMETENAMYDPTTNPVTYMRDAFRVYIGTGSGDWQLLATNDSYRDAIRVDEYDELIFINGEFDISEGAISSVLDHTPSANPAR